MLEIYKKKLEYMFDSNINSTYDEPKIIFYKVRYMHVNHLPYSPETFLSVEKHKLLDFWFECFYLCRRNWWENTATPVFTIMESEKTS